MTADSNIKTVNDRITTKFNILNLQKHYSGFSNISLKDYVDNLYVYNVAEKNNTT